MYTGVVVSLLFTDLGVFSVEMGGVQLLTLESGLTTGKVLLSVAKSNRKNKELMVHDTQITKTNYANNKSYMNDREFMWAGPQVNYCFCLWFLFYFICLLISMNDS